MKITDLDQPVAFGTRTFPLSTLIEDWAARVLKFADDSRTETVRPWTLDDYLGALHLRDVIDRELVGSASGTALPPTLRLADWVLSDISETVEPLVLEADVGEAATRWWWSRIPAAGPVAEDYRESMEWQRASAREQADSEILTALRGVGIDVGSVLEMTELTPEGARVLAESLRDRELSDHVASDVGATLARPGGQTAWKLMVEAYTVLSLYPNKAMGLAAALAEHVTPDTVDDLFPLVSDVRRYNRDWLVNAVLRAGGARGRDVLFALRDDPQIGGMVKADLEDETNR
ncbi:hypothetical protein [Curtobacterium sp. MCBD17_013]|uniref:hypothetical protein n=1 Tax=Curtobacterium sp. MCBD17_013 TaxID=2175668 RepID=UPI0011B39084|nr:hypothetical protein [Curtobacterium sp. MCBD17_013]